jgi:hypothetical protein
MPRRWFFDCLLPTAHCLPPIGGMAKRVVDKRKTAKALRKLQRAAERASAEGAPALTSWEKDFVEGVTGRLETYGSAFRDPGKGRLEEALSQRQAHVARAIDKKTRKGAASDDKATGQRASEGGLRRSEFKRKTPMGQKGRPRVREVNEDMPVGPDPALTAEENRAALRLVRGGKASGKHR